MLIIHLYSLATEDDIGLLLTFVADPSAYPCAESLSLQ
jgi:hypothetical protein